MISIYAFSVFLWVCLCVRAQVEGADITLTKLSRVEKDGRFKLIAEYESESPVEVRWYQQKSGVVKDLTATKQNKGKTVYEVDKEEFGPDINLILGDRRDHFFKVRWNLVGDGDITLPMDFPMAEVTPGTGLVHVPGQVTNVFVKVSESRGEEFFIETSPEMSTSGEYLEGKIVVTSEHPPFLKKSYERKDGVVTTTCSFGEGYSHPINGYFRGYLGGYAGYEGNVPFDSLSEHIILKVHEKSNSGPFPDDFVWGYASDVTCKEYMPGITSCAIECTTYANDMEKVEIYKISNAKEGKQPEMIVVPLTYFKLFAKVNLDFYSRDTPGTYVCRATSKSGDVWEKTITVTVPV